MTVTIITESVMAHLRAGEIGGSVTVLQGAARPFLAPRTVQWRASQRAGVETLYGGPSLARGVFRRQWTAIG